VTERSSRNRVIALLVVTTALGVVLSAVGFFLLRANPYEDSKDRNEITSRATDFAVAYNTYDVSDVKNYQKRLKGLLTPKYDKEFVKITDAVFKALESKKQKSDGAKVQGAAIDSIDKDSAVAIVAVDSKVSNTDTKAAVLRHFRWKVSFTKKDGTWLISSFESIAPRSAVATPSPSATPSEGGGE